MPKELTQETITGDILYLWEVDEYEKFERPWSWYVVMLGVGMLLIIYGMFSGNFLFSLIVILMGMILYLQSKHPAQQIPIGISELGIVVGSRFYKYSELQSFYIVFRPHEIKMLYVQPKSSMRPVLRIPLQDRNPIEIRATLREFMDEDLEKEQEPASDIFGRNWRLW